MPPTPEELARQQIDAALAQAGWVVQNRDDINLAAGQGVAVREFALASGHGFADYLLIVDRQAVGVLEAKKVGHALSGVETQAERYSAGLPDDLTAPVRPLPFLYLSTGVETAFINRLDPDPRTRTLSTVPHIHRPSTLAEWLASKTLRGWADQVAESTDAYDAEYDDTRPSSFRSRIPTLPPLDPSGLRPNQVEAIGNLERSLRDNRPRALVQMATGSGKTIFAITQIYRLIKYAGARRVLFLVDRSNLGEQAEKEFQGYRTADDNRKFTELYNVQLLQSNTIDQASKVVITTIQRLYSMLKGEPDLLTHDEEESKFTAADPLINEPLPVVYNANYPPEYFDVIVVDECHRSIYTLWRQVLEYFDAFLIGLTATPSAQTYGFFGGNLVMEYDHERAVADGNNVDFEVYKILTRISQEGSTVEAGTQVHYRDRETRQKRWHTPDEDVSYSAEELDRRAVSRDQIRTIIRTFKERVTTEIFPGRCEVPKTLIFAKDDNHAEDIVETVREEFGRGNEFCKKITYKVTGVSPKSLIQEFRNSFFPRVVVTVDMIATGTDIKPIEIVMFMRAVKSRLLFEQMKGRGVRTIDDDALKAVTPDARAKTHFVIVDCVGMTETQIADTQPLERAKSVAFAKLLEHVAMGGTNPDYLSSLASRLARLDKQVEPEDCARIVLASGGADLGDLSRGIIEALDPDRRLETARVATEVPEGEEPSEEALQSATSDLLRQATRPLADNPELRRLIQDVKRDTEQLVDEVSRDELLEAGASPEAKEKAKALVQDFEQFLEEHRDEYEALRVFYSAPYQKRLTYADIKALAEAIQAPPRSWTPEKLWRAYEAMGKSVRGGGSSKRMLTDVVSLVRVALHRDDELVPFATRVHERFDHWVAQQRNSGREFTDEQLRWLEMMRDHIETSAEVTVDDFDFAPFAEEGGLGAVRRVLGAQLEDLLHELNQVLTA
ncbi:type I restriction-modification enzyme R subunit C-terminal domain-containing protein [Engelhardtia mirabilis]|uniref:Type-1 restriction enzyme R protein n=1 Tax=Engelhardtia mirabilis TaxID=2528011 RepID=A0A518BH76_9BACT|nr:Type-1 restriction enzyme R protein [Planctomycetes bacterium Pla133]QDV00653.1 Type-1 restriction enzyme R protein [Planctomycetes bacterium Pla86]